MIGRDTVARIDLTALKLNFTLFNNLAPKSKTIAVIKANAYGHGALQVAQALSPMVDVFAVAFFEEAQYLREHSINQPILLLEGPMSLCEIQLARTFNFWPILHKAAHLDDISAMEEHLRPHFWLKIDTGMHRLGIPIKDAQALLLAHKATLQKDTVLCTHLACADDIDNAMTRRQIDSLKHLAEKFNLPVSIANSAAIQAWDRSHGHWNRLGISLYGASPLPHIHPKIQRPVMSLEARIISLRRIQEGEAVGYNQTWHAKRPSLIATVAIGYADGYPRHAPVGTPGLINDKVVPLVGRVSMDMITFDVTDLEQVNCGDKVELWGKNIAVEVVAELAGTISYDLLSGISPRVKRYYIST